MFHLCKAGCHGTTLDAAPPTATIAFAPYCCHSLRCSSPYCYHSLCPPHCHCRSSQLRHHTFYIYISAHCRGKCVLTMATSLFILCLLLVVLWFVWHSFVFGALGVRVCRADCIYVPRVWPFRHVPVDAGAGAVADCGSLTGSPYGPPTQPFPSTS